MQCRQISFWYLSEPAVLGRLWKDTSLIQSKQTSKVLPVPCPPSNPRSVHNSAFIQLSHHISNDQQAISTANFPKREPAYHSVARTNYREQVPSLKGRNGWKAIGQLDGQPAFLLQEAKAEHDFSSTSLYITQYAISTHPTRNSQGWLYLEALTSAIVKKTVRKNILLEPTI